MVSHTIGRVGEVPWARVLIFMASNGNLHNLPLWTRLSRSSILPSGAWRQVDAAAQGRYDCGMTKAKIAITLPQNQLARVHREVRAGRADSVSGYIARVLAEQEERESLRVLLLDLIEQHGQPGAEETKWAKSALASQRRG